MDFKNLIKRFASGDFSQQDEKFIVQLFNDKKYLPLVEEALRGEWESQDKSEKELSHVLYKIHYKLHMEQAQIKRRPMKRVLRWAIELSAAAVLAGIVVFTLFNARERETHMAYAELQAPVNARVQFNLPDGTMGWLNSGATLRYPIGFTKSREVELFGEGFFDVKKKDGGEPFTVNANGSKIIVWGTRFDVIAHENGQMAEVVLEEGEVEFMYESDGGKESVMLAPGDRLVYDNVTGMHTLDQIAPSDYIQWINGRFVIRGESVADFARQFGRVFNMDIIVADKELESVRFRATFENESPEEILRLLRLITPIRYTVEERKMQPDGKFSRKRITLNYQAMQLRQNNGIYE